MTRNRWPTENDRQFLKHLHEEVFKPAPGGKPLGQLTAPEWRAAFARMDEVRNQSDVPPPVLGGYHPAVELRPGLSAAIAVPAGTGPFPVLVITHGPGLTAGSSHLSRRFTMDVASQGYLAVTPDFRLAPEHPFPAGYDDMRYALSWIQENAEQWNADTSRLALWGDSLGAALALGLVLGMQDEQAPPNVKAFIGFDGPYDLAQVSETGAGWYLGPESQELMGDKRVSPLRNIGRGTALPHIMLLTGSASWGLGGTLDMARALQEAQVDFEMHVVDGMPHDFMMFPQLDGKREGHRRLFHYLAKTL